MLLYPLKTKELADYLGVAPATIRLWSRNDEYGVFLSDVATGGDGSVRSFNEVDARILAYIHILKQQGKRKDEVMETLKHDQSNDWKHLPLMPGEVVNSVPIDRAIDAVYVERSKLIIEIDALEQQLKEARDDIQQERSRNDKLQSRINELERDIGIAKGRLEVMQQERRSADYWLRVIVVIILITVSFSVALGVLLISNNSM